MLRTKVASAMLAGSLLFSAGALAASAALTQNAPALMGEVPGAEKIQVNITDGQIDTITGVIYRQVKSLRNMAQLRMTLMIPRNAAKKPAIVYLPGGGFTSADWDKFTEMRYALTRAGFVVAAAEYRPVPVKFPGLVEDARAAVRYIKAHADELGVDPTRVGVLGDSAGGYLAEMLAMIKGESGWDKGENLNVSGDVAAAVSLYGLSDLTSIGEGLSENAQRVHESPAVTEALLVNGVAFRDYPGASIFSDKEKALAASPIGHVDGNESPILLMHGSADALVSPWQSAHLFEALKKKNANVEYVLVEGAGHGDLTWYQASIIERVVTYFKKTLGAPTPAKAEKPNANGNL